MYYLHRWLLFEVTIFKGAVLWRGVLFTAGAFNTMRQRQSLHLVFCLSVAFSPFLFVDEGETKMFTHQNSLEHPRLHQPLTLGSPLDLYKRAQSMIGMHGLTKTVVPCGSLHSPALLRMRNKPSQTCKWKMSCVQNDTETRLSQWYCKLTMRSHP